MLFRSGISKHQLTFLTFHQSDGKRLYFFDPLREVELLTFACVPRTVGWLNLVRRLNASVDDGTNARVSFQLGQVAGVASTDFGLAK